MCIFFAEKYRTLQKQNYPSSSTKTGCSIAVTIQVAPSGWVFCQLMVKVQERLLKIKTCTKSPHPKILKNLFYVVCIKGTPTNSLRPIIFVMSQHSFVHGIMEYSKVRFRGSRKIWTHQFSPTEEILFGDVVCKLT